MHIDYNKWGQHTLAEARYNGRESAIHIRIPAKTVMEARSSFKSKDIIQFEPHIDLKKQPYQFHIFNGTNGDSYIANVPFEYIKHLLWYLHKNQPERDMMLKTNKVIQFNDFKKEHEFVFSKNPGKVWLHVGHEKYGLFDLTTKDRFFILQLHRATLYGTFLRDLDYIFKEKDISDALPNDVKCDVEKGVSLRNAVERSLDLRADGEYTVHSVLESLSLIVDEEDPRLKKSRLQVCKEHNPEIYWTDYKGRRIYRLIDPGHPEKDRIKKELENIVEKECPICEEAKLLV
ncbi:MAG: hypothetical protein Q7J54_00745 [Candidatus Woesearchaeota archaeon]|nr:hypothetical protein [Candidatus Woesearchaeota archaeon]